jgi:hypothetical protein
MKKKMERLDDKLFRPLTEGEQKRIRGAAFHTYTAVTLLETTNPNPDTQRDGDNE